MLKLTSCLIFTNQVWRYNVTSNLIGQIKQLVHLNSLLNQWKRLYNWIQAKKHMICLCNIVPFTEVLLYQKYGLFSRQTPSRVFAQEFGRVSAVCISMWCEQKYLHVRFSFGVVSFIFFCSFFFSLFNIQYITVTIITQITIYICIIIDFSFSC